MFKFSPYCARFQIVTTDDDLTTAVRWPARPLGELNKKRLDGIATTVPFAIALYNNHDKCLHEYRRWLERMLKCNLVMKRRPSQAYRKLWDALLMPCGGPSVFRRTRGGWVMDRGVSRLRRGGQATRRTVSTTIDSPL